MNVNARATKFVLSITYDFIWKISEALWNLSCFPPLTSRCEGLLVVCVLRANPTQMSRMPSASEKHTKTNVNVHKNKHKHEHARARTHTPTHTHTHTHTHKKEDRIWNNIKHNSHHYTVFEKDCKTIPFFLLLFVSIQAPWGKAMLLLLKPMNSVKTLATNVRNTEATQTRHVHDITDSVKMAAPMAVFSQLINTNFEQTTP